MDILLIRKAKKETYTIGKLYINGSYFSDTLEDKCRDKNKNGVFDNGEKKVMHETAIPYGTYKVKLRHSPRFKRILPAILNVPHFEGILIHRGNTAKDTSGCVLVGENKAVGKVLNSTKYELKLVEIIQEAEKRNENITITIE